MPSFCGAAACETNRNVPGAPGQAELVNTGLPTDRVQPPAVGNQVQVWIVRQHQARPGTGTIQHAASDRIDQRATHQDGRAGSLCRLTPTHIGILELPAIVIVTVAFRCRIVGQQNIVRFKLDVIQFDFLRLVIPEDGSIVD
jgi:hypothetical protein